MAERSSGKAEKRWTIMVDAIGQIIDRVDPWQVRPPVESIDVVPVAERDRYRDAVDRFRDAVELLAFHHDVSDGALRYLQEALDG